MSTSNPFGTGDVLEIWFRSISKPSEQTYANLIVHPNASFRLASWWVMGCVFVYELLTQLVRIAFQTAQYQPVNYWVLLFLPLTPIATYIAFNLNVLVVDYLAKLAGRGSIREKLSFALSSLYSPAILLSWFLMIVSKMINLEVILVPFGIYVFLLMIIVIKALYQFSWLKAASIALLSVLISFLLGFPMFGLISLVRYL